MKKDRRISHHNRLRQKPTVHIGIFLGAGLCLVTIVMIVIFHFLEERTAKANQKPVIEFRVMEEQQFSTEFTVPPPTSFHKSQSVDVINVRKIKATVHE